MRMESLVSCSCDTERKAIGGDWRRHPKPERFASPGRAPTVAAMCRNLTIAVMVTALLAACSADTAGSTANDGVSTSSATSLPMPNDQTATVEAVSDGDSLIVSIDGQRSEIRLAGVNAPETDECHGDTSRTMLGQAVDGGEVVLQPVAGENDTDQFGRLLRNVWVGGTWVNESLVRQGGALALQTGSPDEAVLVAAENQAWLDRIGMWDPAACGEFTPGVMVIDVNYDPPGADEENAAAEFALLTNEGGVAVDISGWIVRDESSQHRYRFPEGTKLAPGDQLRLYSGCATDEGLDLYWCADGAVWSNGGDTVLLQTPTGTVASRYKYGGSF
jgi:endonuclease YncB( thermonuclease family)